MGRPGMKIPRKVWVQFDSRGYPLGVTTLEDEAKEWSLESEKWSLENWDAETVHSYELILRRAPLKKTAKRKVAG